MRVFRRGAMVAAAVLTAAALSVYVDAQGTRLPAPMEEWKHNVGDDYFLANYKQLADVLDEAREGVEPAARRRDRQDGRRPADAHGRHHVAGQLREDRSRTRTSRAGSRSPRA